ncbi:hypothetical protein PROVRUST_07911 [Providencia rustigianii DSM 4541]|uniref:DUF1435 domain-containing protein n=1 Tax=Providencia rustigianii DSM 4541 TaxID=500637 RepID=D1P6I7_9GAMM|nr:hypothetical protein PROVRUST_07911 [Providencia rustigianii DSM 4541]
MRRIGAGLWGVFAVVLLSIIYLLSNMGVDPLRVLMVTLMIATAGMLFNRGSRRLLIIPAVLSLACFLLAFILRS